MFRNETAAALARAEAAERELAELRQHGQADDARIVELERTIAEQRAEIERLGKAAGVDARKEQRRKREEEKEAASRERAEKKQRARETPRSSIRSNLALLAIVSIATLGTAATIFGSRACGRHQVETGPGSLYMAHLLRTGQDQLRLLVVSEATTNREGIDSRWRLDLVDPTTGQRLVRRVFERKDRPEVLAADRGRFWCASGNEVRLELREAATLGVKASYGSPAGLYGAIEVDGWSGAAIVTTKSGERLIVDPGTLAARPIRYAAEVVAVEAREGGGRVLLASLQAAKVLGPGHQIRYREGDNITSLPDGLSATERRALMSFPRVRQLGTSQHGTSSSADLEDVFCSFVASDGGPRQMLQVKREQVASVLRDSSFLSPSLVLANERSYQALALPHGGGLIVEHTDSLDRNAGRLLLSRLSLDGKLHWTITEPNGRVTMGFLHGDLVVLALESKPSALLGIAWRDGTVRWRYNP